LFSVGWFEPWARHPVARELALLAEELSMRLRWLKRATLAAVAAWGVSQALCRLTATPAEKPLCLAHRGASALAPENTVAAFEEAGRLRADYWETDVRQTRDGLLVLMHDSTVDRTTAGRGPVEALTGPEAEALGVCTVRRYLELAQEYDTRVLPEVKGSTPGIEAALVDALRSAGMLDRCCVQSFSVPSLERLHALCPELPLARLYYPGQFWLGSVPVGVKVVAPMAETLLAWPWMVRAAHARGLKVWPWFAGLESSVTVGWLLSLGVDGLIVNDPRRLR